MTEPSLALTAIGMMVGGVVWLVRLEGRVRLGESRLDDMRNDVSEIKTDVKALLAKQYERRKTDA